MASASSGATDWTALDAAAPGWPELDWLAPDWPALGWPVVGGGVSSARAAETINAAIIPPTKTDRRIEAPGPGVRGRSHKSADQPNRRARRITLCWALIQIAGAA